MSFEKNEKNEMSEGKNITLLDNMPCEVRKTLQ